MTGRSFRGVVARGGVVGVLLLLVTAGGSAVLAADHAVDIAGFAFSPGSVTVAVGDTVTWTNADAQNHTATADDGSWDTGTISSSTPKSVTFATAGTFAYHCKIHRSMTATVVVQGSGATIPPADTLAPEPAGPPASRGIELALLAVAGLGGGLLAQRRFSRRRA